MCNFVYNEFLSPYIQICMLFESEGKKGSSVQREKNDDHNREMQ